MWDPELHNWNYLFARTKTAIGGQPSPHYRVAKIFNTDFGSGTQLYKATFSFPDIEVLASTTRSLLINKRNAYITVQLNGFKLMMTPYEVRLLDKPNSRGLLQRYAIPCPSQGAVPPQSRGCTSATD